MVVLKGKRHISTCFGNWPGASPRRNENVALQQRPARAMPRHKVSKELSGACQACSNKQTKQQHQCRKPLRTMNEAVSKCGSFYYSTKFCWRRITKRGALIVKETQSVKLCPARISTSQAMAMRMSQSSTSADPSCCLANSCRGGDWRVSTWIPRTGHALPPRQLGPDARY